MNTIKQALRKSPVAAALTLVIAGFAIALALVGIVYPEAWRLAGITLSIIMMAVGLLHFVLRLAARQPVSAADDYRSHFRQSHQQRIRLGFGIQFTTIRNGQRVERQMQWAMA